MYRFGFQKCMTVIAWSFSGVVEQWCTLQRFI